MKEQDITWDYVEGLLRQMVANENWNVVTAEDAQEQLNRRLKFIEGIKYEFNKLTPTPPTQEKEDDYCAKCEDCNPISPKIKLVQKKVNIDPQIFKDLELHVNEKPTQDTESWLEEFDRNWPEFKGVGAPFPMFEDTPVRSHIIQFIKQKKQEWSGEEYVKGYHQGKRENEHFLDEARTQGAEAAVEKIRSEQDEFAIGVYGQGTEFSQYSFDEACKEAKKV